MSDSTQCPECNTALSLSDDTVEGEVIACTSCEAELEVIGVDPYELALAPEMAEDWGE
jgi:alpha-aminoadipate carrier protein LysW